VLSHVHCVLLLEERTSTARATATSGKDGRNGRFMVIRSALVLFQYVLAQTSVRIASVPFRDRSSTFRQRADARQGSFGGSGWSSGCGAGADCPSASPSRTVCVTRTRECVKAVEGYLGAHCLLHSASAQFAPVVTRSTYAPMPPPAHSLLKGARMPRSVLPHLAIGNNGIGKTTGFASL